MTASKVNKGVQQEVFPTWKRIMSGVLIALGILTFFLAQSTLWVSQNFFNQERFVGTAKQVLATDESRQAIARTIVDAAFKERPVAQQLVGSQVTALVSGMLGSDLAGRVYDRVADRAYAYVTSPDREDIAIDLTSIKEPLTAIVGLVERTGREITFEPSDIPDSITLIESDTLPDVSGYIRMMLFASGALWFATVASFVTYVWLNRGRLVRSLYVVGWSIIAVAIFAVLSGPFIPPALASLVNLIGIRGLVEDMTVAFLQPFQVQMLSAAVIAAFAMLVISLRGAIRAGIVRLVALFK